MNKRAIQISLLLVTIVLALVIVGVASAELKATAVFYAWDAAKNEYLNSQVTLYWDGSWVPFLHELGFDREVVYPPACDVNGDGTTWAGTMDFGLYHTDNAPAGAKGSCRQPTGSWSTATATAMAASMQLIVRARLEVIRKS